MKLAKFFRTQFLKNQRSTALMKIENAMLNFTKVTQYVHKQVVYPHRQSIIFLLKLEDLGDI